MGLLEDMGKRFCQMRMNKGYTLEMVSNLTSVSLRDLRCIEQGSLIPPYSVYDWLCAIYGTTFKHFMSTYKWTYTEPKREDINHAA